MLVTNPIPEVTVWVIVVILVVRCRGGVGVPIVARVDPAFVLPVDHIPLPTVKIQVHYRVQMPVFLRHRAVQGVVLPPTAGVKAFLFKSGHSDYLPFFAP